MRIEVYKDAAKLWRWRLIAKNNKIVADSGESYVTKWGCRRAAKKFIGL